MLPLRIPRPERAEGTVLAALLAVLLAVMLVAQVVLPQDRPTALDLPSAGLRGGSVTVAAVSADPVLARRSIFQPVRLGSGAADVPAGPLDGAIPAGIMRVRGAAQLVLQTPDGDSVTLRPGQSWQGWRLIAISNDKVRFARGGESVTLGLGGAAGPYSNPGYAPQAYNPSDYSGRYRPNQADEQ